MQVLRFGCNLLLTRLLAPKIIGVMALVNLFIQGLYMFSDFGLRQGVVQSPRGDEPDFLNTAWTLQVLRGLVLWACAAVLAWPAARFYDAPALVWLIPLAGTTAVLTGFNSTALFTLSRRLLPARLKLLEIGTYLVGMGTTFALIGVLALRQAGAEADAALQDRQLRTLAAGYLAASVFEMTVSHRLLRGHRHRFRLEPRAARSLFHFGGWIFLSTACTFLGNQADRLVVGKISLDVLGVYHIAAMLVAMPTILTITLGLQLVFPYYSRSLRAGRPIREVYGRVHLVLKAFAGLMASALIATAPSLVECLYDARYHPAGRYAQLLAVAAWFTMLQNSGEIVLLATARTRWLALAQALRLVALPALLVGGYHLGGLPGMIGGFAAAEAVRYMFTSGVVRRLGLPVLRYDIILSGLVFGIGLAVAYLDPLGWGGWPKFARLAGQAITVALLWLLLAGAWRFLRSGPRWTSPPAMVGPEADGAAPRA